MVKEICIYKIKSPSGKIYIGQTRNLYLRKIHYKKLHCRKQRKLYCSFLKYGFENHEFTIIEYCAVDQLNEREKHWINFYNSFNNGLNLTTGGDCHIKSMESRRLISEAKMGAKNWMFGKKGKLSPKYGKSITEDTRNKLISSHLDKMKGSKNSYFKGFVYAYKGDKLIGAFEGIHDAARKLNLQHPNISKVILGKRHHTGGYYFIRNHK